jgi:hypothetical protein
MKMKKAPTEIEMSSCNLVQTLDILSSHASIYGDGNVTLYNKVVNLITDKPCNPIFGKNVSKWSLAATLIIV